MIKTLSGKLEPVLPAACYAACQCQLCSLRNPCVAENGPLLRDSEVQAVLGSNVLPVFRLLHAQVAAAAAVLSQNIRSATGHTPVCSPLPPPPP